MSVSIELPFRFLSLPLVAHALETTSTPGSARFLFLAAAPAPRWLRSPSPPSARSLAAAGGPLLMLLLSFILRRWAMARCLACSKPYLDSRKCLCRLSPSSLQLALHHLLCSSQLTPLTEPWHCSHSATLHASDAAPHREQDPVDVALHPSTNISTPYMTKPNFLHQQSLHVRTIRITFIDAP